MHLKQALDFISYDTAYKPQTLLQFGIYPLFTNLWGLVDIWCLNSAAAPIKMNLPSFWKFVVGAIWQVKTYT